MTKLTKKSQSRSLDPQTTLDLRRWCIEEAIRWPMIQSPYGGTFSQAAIYNNLGPSEANILDRAKRIFDWVTQ